MSILSRQDPEIARAIELEAARQHDKIELIASETSSARRCWKRKAQY